MTGARWWRTAVLVGAIAAAGSAGWWAASATLVQEAQSSESSTAPVTVVVSQGSVGRTLTLNATVTLPFESVAVNRLVGTVTSVGADSVGLGDVLYAVDELPVRALTGRTPFYRDLDLGAVGEDVRQLQDGLHQLGFYGGTVDGKLGASTQHGVRAWQRSTGAQPTGVVRVGEVVAVPVLPGRVQLGEDVTVGALLAGGEEAVLAQSGDPRFALVVTSEQAVQVPADALVDVQGPRTLWTAVVADHALDESGGVALALQSPGGGPVCADSCAELAGTAAQTLNAQVHVVPDATGAVVPVAALTTDANGAASVVLADGARVAVTVVASGDGTAVVDGLTVGQRVVVSEAGDGG